MANGDVPVEWAAFLQEILKHGSRFYHKKSLNMGPIFRFSQGEKPENRKICKKMGLFLKKNP